MTEILTRKEVSEFLKLPIRSLDYLVATGQIPFFRIGKRSVRFSKDRLMEYLNDREYVEYHCKKK
jgi:excisionase family DNA binding protein